MITGVGLFGTLTGYASSLFIQDEEDNIKDKENEILEELKEIRKYLYDINKENED